VDQHQSRFDLATVAATQILDELGEGDLVAMFVTNGPPLTGLGKLDMTQEKIRQVLPQCHASHERADLAGPLREARKLLSAADATNKHIFILTDMQLRSWDSLMRSAGSAGVAAGSAAAAPAAAAAGAAKASRPSESESAPDVPVIVVDCSHTPRPNVAVTQVELKTAAPVVGFPITVGASLWNTSPQPQQRTVDLLIDDIKQQSSPTIAMGPNGRQKHEFAFILKRGGLHRGEVRLVGEDGSKMDDRRFFTLEVNQSTPTAIVKPKRHEIPYLEESFYLERALSPGKADVWALAPAPLVADELRTAPLEKYRAIYCVDLPAPDTATATRLREYVAGGGALIWIAGEHVVPEEYDRMNDAAGGQLLPAPLVDVRKADASQGRDSWSIGFLDATKPTFAPLVDPPKLYRSVLVNQHVRMAADKAAGVEVLARLDDGEPLLVQRTVGRGKVLMLGTGVHTDWSNLPLRPIFMPLMVRLTVDLAGTKQVRHEGLAGMPLTLTFENLTAPVAVEVRRPTGETFRLHTQSTSAQKPQDLHTEGQSDKKQQDVHAEVQADQKGQVFQYADTHEIGIYGLKSLDASQPLDTAFSVNADPDEPDPARIEQEDLQGRLAPAPLVLAADPADLSATFARLREGRSLWSVFLWCVLAVLVLETAISNWLNPKNPEDAKGATGLPRGRSPATITPTAAGVVN
jgi:hypothetical protein